MSDGYSLEQAERFGWSSLTGRLHPERLAFLAEDLPSAGSVLDVGCGPGGWSAWMVERGHRVVSCDAQAEFLRSAPAALSRIQADAARLPFPDRSFDAVVCLDVLEHIEDDLAALRELMRVARRRVLIAVPRRDDSLDRFNLTFLHWQDRTHRRAYREQDLQALLAAAGSARNRVRGELALPLRDMLAALVRINPGHDLPELLRRSPLPPWRRDHSTASIDAANRRILSALEFPVVHTGLVAVLDLETTP